MYKRGIVSSLDATTHRARVTFPDRQDLESPWLDVLVRGTHLDKDYGLPAVGDQVAVMMDDNDEAGCILGALYSSEDAPPPNADTRRGVAFGDGGLIEYDRTAHVLRITVPAGGRVELAGADEPIALAQKVRSELDAIKSAFDAHTHAAGSLVGIHGPVSGVTGAPPSPPYSPNDVASAQVHSA